jgi:CelD/BcsL family acetyltransferase involved in cellulose biosynthesis
MSLYASTALAAALAAAEDVPTRVSAVACDEHTIPVVFAAGRPVLDRVWLDYLEPSTDVRHVPESFVRYVPRLVVGKVSAEQWHADVQPTAAARQLRAAPTIDLSRFGSWDEVEAWIRTKRSNLVKNAARLARKAERELGALTFTAADPDEEAFEQLLGWKRAHYQRTGVGDPLAVPANAELMRSLFRSGTLEHSSLRADGRLLAGIALVRQAGRVYYWLPSYDTELAALTPGNLTLLRSIRHAYDSGEREYDFMIGDEDYKWFFATDVRVVGPVGTMPVVRRARRLVGTARRRLLAGAPAGGSAGA